MTLKKDTRRDLGKRLVNREKTIWEENGWVIENNLRWVWTKVGMRQVTITDYFGRYDFLAAWPSGGIMALVQVSKTSEGKHKPPLGFLSAPSKGPSTPDDLMAAPKDNPMGFKDNPMGFKDNPMGFKDNPMGFKDNPMGFNIGTGVFEIYVYYRKLKSVDAREWAADRRWWVG